jgi:thiamine biosynthesis protein ThiI
MTVVVHYAEIGLKRGNRAFFEGKLIENIRSAAANSGITLKAINKESGRILCHFAGGDQGRVEDALRRVFGVKYFAIVEKASSTEEALLKKVRGMVRSAQKAGKESLAIAARRADKQFPLSSSEVNRKLGAEASKMGMRIDLGNPDVKVFIEIGLETTYLYTRKIPGPGGLPVSSSGKVLALLSGGIDSPVAAWLMMKRGCRVDYLHFHAMMSNREVLATKIGRIVGQLNRFQNGARLLLVPYHEYQILTAGKIPEKLDLVAFKSYMFRLAQQLAEEHRYKALITGDSVGQVASQTLQNITATDSGIEIPILRPLVGLDKQEIVDLATAIGTYEESIGKYKDCCSIISRKPSTAVKREELENALGAARISEVLEKSRPKLETFKIGPWRADKEQIAEIAESQAASPLHTT